MKDYIVRATAGGGQIRAFAAYTKEVVETARKAHNTSPVITAALGRLLSAAAMMGVTLKGEDDLLTLKINGSGPAKGLVVTADPKGNVKGYALVPDVILPPNAAGKLDVSGALGIGILSVIKDMGLKDPYVGQVELKTGEIAEDLTYYFAASEQVPSAVGLGVLMNKDNTVRQAGGFIVQLMPYAQEELIAALEKKLSGMPSVTTLLDEGKTPEDLIEYLLGDLEPEILQTYPTAFSCNCEKKRVEKALIAVGKQELDEMIDEGKPIEVKCQFCGKAYSFTKEELQDIRKKCKPGK
ncbi:MAG: Hsp33 family molecular chaperone HslO [Lachnospiraceae bacterium]|nr:Hsp33 family molecular chaperone HslO [Lachnospiraceae bacterium]